MEDPPVERIPILDHGYVRLVDQMGSDLTVVNAARVSLNKESGWDAGQSQPRLKVNDRKLLHYLIQHGHTSPLRHCTLSFEVYAPLMVMRQWGKYRVGSSWSFADSDDPLETINESSRRYITEDAEFYIPAAWRSAPENKKQGSGGPIPDTGVQHALGDSLDRVVAAGLDAYRGALDHGVCVEQARLYLPAYAMYIRARWTVSLQGVLHFLEERLKPDAQWEIQEYARGIQQLAEPRFPETFAEWRGCTQVL